MHCYDKRSAAASDITMFGADVNRRAAHGIRMLGSNQLLDVLRDLKAKGVTTNADLARLLNLPSPRIAEMFDGKRRITIDEMKTLVEAYGLEGEQARPAAPTADNLAGLLDAILPLAPKGRLTDQSLRALAEALSHGLGLLGDQLATKASQDAIAVAARAAVVRFRETA